MIQKELKFTVAFSLPMKSFYPKKYAIVLFTILGCASLVTACQKYVKKFFAKVYETEEFMNLEIEEVSEIISEDELFVTSEQFVFNAVVKWVKYDRELREEHLPYLLAKVRLPLLTPQFLSDTVASEELIRSSHRCRFVQFRLI